MSKILRNSVTLFTMVVNKYKPLHKSNISQIIVATVVSPITVAVNTWLQYFGSHLPA